MKKILLIFLIMISLVSAQESTNVIKSAPDIIKAQDNLNVEIRISNPNLLDKNYQVIETIPQGFTLIDPSEPNLIEQHNALTVMIYKWDIIIPAGQIFTINYIIKPNQVGEYTIPPTKVNDLSTNDVFLSEPKHITASCVPNNVCDGNENAINCPEDCKQSMKDGICEYKADGICDPDCEEEPDCKNIKTSNYIYIIAILLIVLILIIFLIKKFTK